MLTGMRRPIMVRPLLDAEREQMEAGLRSSDAFVVRRCQVLLASAEGRRAPQIAAALRCSDQTARDAIHAFTAHGLACLTPGSSRPHTVHAAFDAAGAERLRALLHQCPRAYGKPSSVWTLALVAEVACAQGLTAGRVTGETVRATLARLGIGWKRAKRWITSPDPEYAQKKRAVTA
jgi:transposase